MAVTLDMDMPKNCLHCNCLYQPDPPEKHRCILADTIGRTNKKAGIDYDSCNIEFKELDERAHFCPIKPTQLWR